MVGPELFSCSLNLLDFPILKVAGKFGLNRLK
jgi:hypothetical protein